MNIIKILVGAYIKACEDFIDTSMNKTGSFIIAAIIGLLINILVSYKLLGEIDWFSVIVADIIMIPIILIFLSNFISK